MRVAVESVESRVCLAVVAGSVFEDINANGLYESTIDRSKNAAVVYADSNTNAKLDAGESSATTNASGSYQLSLPAGTHVLRQSLPTGTVQTSPADGSGWTVVVPEDSDTVTPPKFLRYTPNQNGCVIGGRIFHDANGNATADTGETANFPLGAVWAFIDRDGDGRFAAGDPSTSVTGDGLFAFVGLVPGTYKIDFYTKGWADTVHTTPRVTADAQLGLITTLPAAGLQQVKTYPVYLTAFTDVDSDGAYGANDGSFVNGRTIYADLNDNGALDAGEPSTVSSSVANTSYLALRAGQYTLRQVLPNGFVETGRVAATAGPGSTFVADGRLRTPDDLVNDTATLRFGARPIWLTAGAGAAYRIEGSTLTVSAGTVTLTADAGATTPGTTLVVSNTSQVTLTASQHLGTVTLTQSGRLTLAAGGQVVLRMSAINANWASSVDLNDNAIIYDYSSGSNIYSIFANLIASGRGNGTWPNFGITSSAARNHPTAATTIGYLDAADYLAVHGATAKFAGETVDSTTVLVKYALYGDTDLDGGVSINDFNRLSASFGKTSDRVWFNGDVDNDFGVSINDFNLLAANFGKTLTPPPALPVIRKGVAPAKR